MIYPNYKAMTYDDARAMNAINRKNGYGISYAELKRLGSAHRIARQAGNVRVMEKIEYRLTDINFHHECSLLHNGEYDTLANELRAR